MELGGNFGECLGMNRLKYTYLWFVGLAGFLLLWVWLKGQNDSGMKEAVVVKQAAVVEKASEVAEGSVGENGVSEEPLRGERSRVREAQSPNMEGTVSAPVGGADAGLKGWEDARVLKRAERAGERPGMLRRVVLLQPADLPYPVRVEVWVEVKTGRVMKREEMVADRVLVQRRAGVSEEALRGAVASAGGVLGKQVSLRGLYVVETAVLEVDGVPDLLERLAGLEGLVYAEPDHVVQMAAVPNDPLYVDGRLWGFHNTGQAGGTGDRDEGVVGTLDADMDAPEGWGVRTDASSVVVAVIDTGVRYDHEDLAGNMWVNPGEIAGNGVDDDGNGYIDDVHGINALSDSGDPMDDHDHGTHVAGTIGGVGNNGTGVTGVAWSVQLMACKFLGASGGSVSDAIESIDYAVAQGADILSNSWGGGAFNQSLKDAIVAARDAGVIFVAAAGNDTVDNDVAKTYPSSYEVDNIVSVAATDRQDTLADFSNWGFGSVQIAAPGVAIWSSVHGSTDAYESFSGTSMATPMVSGVLALLQAEYPGDSMYERVNRLLNGADAVASLEGEVLTGGRLNLYGALTETDVRPLNDDFAGRLILGEEVNYVRTNTYGATVEAGEPVLAGAGVDPKSLWFEFTASTGGAVGISTGRSGMNVVVGVYTGDGSSLMGLVAEPSLTGGGSGQAFFMGEAGRTYYLSVAGAEGVEGLVSMTVAGPPENNNIADAFEMTGLEFFTGGTLLNADKEAGEPDHAGNAGGVSVWWKWTCPASNEYTLSTRSRLDVFQDTLLAVYTAADPLNPSVESITLVAENDDEPGVSTASRIRFQGVAGVTYFFAVDGKDGQAAPVSLQLFVAPGNDDFEDAYAILGELPLRIRGTTSHASLQEGEPDHAGMGGQSSVWYTFTPGEDMTLSVETDTFSDTVLAVYRGSELEGLTEVVSDDDSGLGFNARVVFEAERNVTYRIAVDYLDYFLGSEFDLLLERIVIPGNDMIADATLLEGNEASGSGSNMGAGSEAGEPGYDGAIDTVWFRWAAPRSGAYGIYVRTETDVAPLVKVYTGSDLAGFTDFVEVAGDRFSGIGYDAFAELAAVAGETYYLQVGGYGNGSMPFTVDIKPKEFFRPVNDDLAGATVIDPAEGLHYAHSHNYAASAEPGEPYHAGRTGRKTVWWRMTVGPGQGGEYFFSPAGTEHDEAGVAVYTAPDPEAPLVTDLTLVAENSGLDPVSGVPSYDLVFTEVSWTALEGETYFIGLETTVRLSDNLGVGRVVATCHRVAANAAFANAAAVPPEGGSFQVYNHASGTESGEPNPVGKRGKKSVWWLFTPAETGTYQIDTFGSERFWNERSDQSYLTGSTWRAMDTNLGIYTGTAVDGLTLVEDADSYTNESYDLTWSTENRWSRVIRTLEAGTAYYILVDGEPLGFDNEADATTTGRVHLNVVRKTPPVNDNFADAAELAGAGTIQVSGNNEGATVEPGEPVHGLSSGGQSVWWKWTAPVNGVFYASTAGKIYEDDAVRNTGLGVYVGNAVNTLSLVGADDDSAGMNSDTSALVSFSAAEGTTYYFAVDADDLGAQGSEEGAVSLILTPGPDHDDFMEAREMTGSRWSDVSHNIGATTEAGEPLIEYWNPQPATNRRSAWWMWTAPVSGYVTVDTYGSQIVPVLGVFTGSDVGALSVVAWDRYSGEPYNGHDRAERGNTEVGFQANAGTRYYICVQGAGWVTPMAGLIQLNLDGPPGIPETPTEFVAQRTGDGQVELSWTDRAVDESVYVLERSTDLVNWVVVTAQIPQDGEQYSDYDIQAGESVYYYRLHAEGPGGVGASVMASTAPPPIPQAFSAVGVDIDRIDLSWDSVAFAGGYVLERSETGEGNWLVIATPGSDVTAYSDRTNLNAATRYYYRMKAVGNGESETTEVVSAFTAGGETLWAYEGFDYAAGEVLGAQNGGAGWIGGWGDAGASGGTVSGSSLMEVAAGSMGLPPGYTAEVTGNRIAQNTALGAGIRAVRVLERPIDLSTDGTVYFSFLVNTSGAGSGGFARLGFFKAGTWSARVFDAGVWNSQYWIRSGTEELSAGAGSYTAGTDVLLVGRIVHRASENDTVSLQLYGPGNGPGAEPAIWGVTYTLDSEDVLNRVFLEINDPNIEQFDEIKVGETFAGMFTPTVSPRAPAAPSRLVAVGVSSGVDLSWMDNSSNETGFVVEESAEGEVWTVLAALPAGSIHYSHIGLDVGAVRHYRVRAVNAAGESGNAVAGPVAVPHSFAAWGLANGGITDPLDDADGNGIPAVMEYAFKRIPGSTAPLPIEGVISLVEGESYYSLRFDVRTDTADLIYEVQYAQDLSIWDPDAVLWQSAGGDLSHQVSVADQGDGRQTVVVRYAEPVTGTARIFLRMVLRLQAE